MAFILRSSFTERGAMTFTGNTLGLSKGLGTNTAGVEDSIGAFTSLNLGLQVPTFPPGTTLLWPQNGSTAVLNLPLNATVLHAEIIWGGSSIVTGGDVSAFLNTPITLTGNALPMVVVPDPVTSRIITNAAGIQFYVRTQDVTAFVQAQGAGIYSVEGVPATVSATDDVNNAAGWTLAVIYMDPAETIFRNMTLFLGLDNVEGGAPPVDISISGFGTPPSGPFNTRVLSSTLEGDANKSGDTLQFGPTVASLTALSGPNNPVNNFFASQLNDDSGNLDVNGTFGNRNQNALGGMNIVAGRQSWDITNVNATGTLPNNQTSAVSRFTTVGEGYNPHTLGVQIDVSAPIIQMIKSGPSIAEIGDVFTYTVQIQNTGTVSADNIIFTDNIPIGLSFVPGTIRVNNNPVGGNPTIGVPIGNLAPMSMLTVTFDVLVEQQITPVTLNNDSFINYNFISVAGGPVLDGDAESNDVDTMITPAQQITIVKSANTTRAQKGDTITYTLTLTNETETQATNLVVTDALTDEVEFVQDSVTIDGNPVPGASPETGINIASIDPDQVIVITFDVIVLRSSCPSIIINQSEVVYTVGQDREQSISNEVRIELINTEFKQLIFSDTITIPVQKPDVEEILSQTAKVVITSTRLIETISQTSLENQVLTGNKIVINGYLEGMIEYIALNCIQSVHSVEFKQPFSSFVVLGGDFDPDVLFNIDEIIEEFKVEILNERELFISILVKLDIIERE